jgi:hypothetical protein
MGFQDDDEVVITQFGNLIITKVVLRWEDQEGNLWLNLKEPQTGTLFRRRESTFRRYRASA